MIGAEFRVEAHGPYTVLILQVPHPRNSDRFIADSATMLSWEGGTAKDTLPVYLNELMDSVTKAYEAAR